VHRLRPDALATVLGEHREPQELDAALPHHARHASADGAAVLDGEVDGVRELRLRAHALFDVLHRCQRLAGVRVAGQGGQRGGVDLQKEAVERRSIDCGDRTVAQLFSGDHGRGPVNRVVVGRSDAGRRRFRDRTTNSCASGSSSRESASSATLRR